MNLYYTKYFDLGTVMPAVFPEMSDGSGPQDESILWVEEAKKRGIKKILVTHPDHFFIQRQFIQLCFSDQEIDQMVRINPSRLLNLS